MTVAERPVDTFAVARARMAERQLEQRGISDVHVLAAMRTLPREFFVPESLREFAYEDAPLPIAAGQTISQPYIVALMVELAAITPGAKVLEVGAGCGYASAVMAMTGAHVFAIERHIELVEVAERNIARAGLSGVTVIRGDGTRGLPEEAPFDAIVVSAGGRRVPDALVEQLAIGGRLVIPVGPPRTQVLKRIIRADLARYDEESHGLVSFVPLIGRPERAIERRRLEQSVDAEQAPVSEPRQKTSQASHGLASRIAQSAEPFGEMHELAEKVDRFADRRIVMLGASTHGTAEFYEARTWMTERLVALHGFDIVAVEADWPDAAAYDAYIRDHRPPAVEHPPFTRFPRWLWRNPHVYDLLDRLQAINKPRPAADRAGFFGLDIYSLGSSIDAVLDFLDHHDAEAARVARERYACLLPWRADPARYGRLALSAGFSDCEAGVAAVLRDLMSKRLAYLERDGDKFFDAERNARIAVGAEHYYRTMYYGSPQSWNLRDQHMFDTLQALLDHRGANAKAVVWAHNAHVGDARETEVGRIRGEHTLGELARKAYGDGVALIGFGTDHGTVAAAPDWGAGMEAKPLVRARNDSWEAQCRDSRTPAFFLDFTRNPAVRAKLSRTLLERAVGVVYRPDSELSSHYFAAEVAQQFDAWVWFERTRAIEAAHQRAGEPTGDTYPFGV